MPAVVSDLPNKSDPAELQIAIASARRHSIRAMSFAIEDPVESCPITFDECQSQSLDPKFEAVKFKGLRLSQP